MSEWRVYARKADFKALGDKFGIDQVTARVMRNRGIVDEAGFDMYLNGTVEKLGDWHDIKDMENAVAIINSALASGDRIRIIGDYDIDGICSIYILHKGLKYLGADVDYVVPDRIVDGYGLNVGMVEACASDGVGLIVTCDNGIAAYDAVARARELGIDVIVTDHHNVPYEDDEGGGRKYVLPPACAVVDTKQEDCEYPFKEMCGAGIALRLVEALTGETLGKSAFLEGLIEMAAIATVGDVVELQGENRIIVREGLKSINAGTQNVGLKALMESCGIEDGCFDSYHIGFVVGPCLNASGRLDTARKAIELLECSDSGEALQRAQELKDLNDQRKKVTEDGVAAAVQAIGEEYGEAVPQVLMVYLKDCHESVAGIIAGRIRELYYRPTLVFTDAIGELGYLKASGRSIEGYDMHAGITICREMLVKFGGHCMAAGLTMERGNYDAFREKMLANAGLDEKALTPVRWIDVPMPLEYVTEGVIESLARLEPFGKGNEKPLFADRGLTVRRKRIIGKNGNVLRLTLVTGTGYVAEGVMFRVDEAAAEGINEGDVVSVLYYPGINEYRGNRSVQFVIQEIKK
jgi:single-stranded-DNA-specific exonuclease